MSRLIGTIVRGIRMPIFMEGDDLVSLICERIGQCVAHGDLQAQDQDIVAVTESVVARAQGNYICTAQISADLKAKLPADCKKLAITFPILSRNRFSILLKAFAQAVPEIDLVLAYPQDEVGNPLMDAQALITSEVNPYRDLLTEEEFHSAFGNEYTHPFTGINYGDFYRSIIEEAGAKCQIFYGNDPVQVVKISKDILTCDIHTRARSKKLMKAAGARTVLGLDDIATSPVVFSDEEVELLKKTNPLARKESGYNATYGLLGSNKANEDTVKLFPRQGQDFVDALAEKLKELLGKQVEVMIYGDGAFKDPQAGIWELADPVVSPGFTKGLEGRPSELKIKYLADTDLYELDPADREKALIEQIAKKDSLQNIPADNLKEGTTPRRIVDLLGSLSDLCSGSGDKGTPVVYIQNYLDNFARDQD